MVVPVFMTSCHVSENLKSGPETAHNSTTAKAIENAGVLPTARVTFDENLSKNPFFLTRLPELSFAGKFLFSI